LGAGAKSGFRAEERGVIFLALPSRISHIKKPLTPAAERLFSIEQETIAHARRPARG
jgi:hypothetical protein